MKAFISADLEGMPFIVIPGHLKLKGSLYDEARRVATRVVLTVADELHKNGFNEVIAADSHGPMVNLMVEDLPEYLEVVRGFPRPVCMVSGIEGCDAACFIGYHAKAGTPRSTMAHTYSGANVHKVQVNGVEASEFLLNAYVAGELGVPVIMVAGEAKLIEDDVKKHASWIETVVLKRSMSSSAGKSASLLRIEKELRTSVGKAVSSFKQNKTALLTTKTPVRASVSFKSTHQADAAELLPSATRVDGLTVEYSADTMLKAYTIFELLILAATGSTAILADMK